MRQTPIEYTRKASRARETLIQPSPSLGRTIRKLGIRRLIRQGFWQTHYRKNQSSRTCESHHKTIQKRRVSVLMVSRARPTHVAYCNARTSLRVWPPIYIGKESDKRWEEGEDLSLLEFKTIEYKRKGYAIATDEQLQKIATIPKREFMRRGINQHTLEKICSKEPVLGIKIVGMSKNS
jgi:hypothetical protein